MITDQTGLTVKGYNSGPLGGDQQIGAKIVEGVMRIAQVYDIPMAVNKATADFMITSEYMASDYQHDVINFKKTVQERAETL